MEFDKKKFSSWFMIFTIIIIIGGFNVSYFIKHISSNTESIVDYNLKDDDINPVREAAVAGIFYPADVYQLKNDINGYLQHITDNNSGKPKILITPHAGYKYSAQVAASAFAKLRPFKDKIKKVFLLGPSHRVYVNGVALPKEKSFKTPLGIIKVDSDIVEQISKTKPFKFKSTAHKNEHSLEVSLPFLQVVLGNFEIIPMLYGEANPHEIAQTIQPYLERDDSILIVSADLSHYLDYSTAKKVDEQTANNIKEGKTVDHHQSCGATAINTALIMAQNFGLVPQMLNMANSGDVIGDKDSVVGYGAWSFEKNNEDDASNLEGIDLEEKNLQNFARHYKNAIIQIVERALIDAVKNNKIYSPERNEYEDILFNKGASFVTLKKHNILRGCMGSIFQTNAIAKDLSKNTFLAAMNDPRFEPLKEDELNDIVFSVSLLTGFEGIKFTSYDDLINKIRPNTDGLLIKDGKRQGLFLPSVWDDIPNKKEFLNELKIKAGLSPNYWSDNIEVFRFKTVEITK